ncbi:MAG: biotin-dependent carboxyltransferase family protein, partial [Synergistaceae bacterium]|nr:biotin-dependent carboxyltransferase family protein [Synergistaceae bacterium]
MKLSVEKPGLFTTVQDLGRRGYQMQGVPVAGAMDGAALRLGNILLGNERGPDGLESAGLEPAGLEITVVGPSIKVLEGSGCFVVTGAEAGVTKNGVPLLCWTVHRLDAGDTIVFSAPKGGGSRSYFCVSGGIDVPPVMGSRSAYTRGRFGGHEGRALKAGDVLATGTPDALWADCEGLSCPPRLRPVRDPDAPLRVIPGPQDDLFTEEGLKTFYSSEYVITNSADRMG